MAKETILLMPDYGCHPLWWRGDHPPGDIDPASLPISPTTQAALAAWAATFESWLDPNDPAGGPEPSPAAAQAFEAEGVRLWRTLRAELGASYLVLYKSQRLKRILDDPAELGS